MSSLTNKAFSDWYDSQHGEPSYQQTFEAGQAHRPKEFDAELLRIAERAIDKKLIQQDQVDTLRAELDACAAALPGPYYMDFPDGGSVTVGEQVARMAKDAARYRWLQMLNMDDWHELASLPASTLDKYIDSDMESQIDAWQQ